MVSPDHLQHYNARADRLNAVGPSRLVLLQSKSPVLPSIIGPDAESHTLLSSSQASASHHEGLGRVTPFSESMCSSSSPLSFYTANSSPSASPALLWYSVKPELYAWSFSTSQQEGLKRSSPFSTNPSPLSFYTANTSTTYLSTRQATASPATVSSRVSSPYSVTSVNSYKSRKTVLYRRRAHPIPASTMVSPVSPEYVVSLDVRHYFSFLLLLLINRGGVALCIGPDLGSSIPLHDLVAAHGASSRTGGNVAPAVSGLPRRSFPSCFCSGERGIPLLFRSFYCVNSRSPS